MAARQDGDLLLVCSSPEPPRIIIHEYCYQNILFLCTKCEIKVLHEKGRFSVERFQFVGKSIWAEKKNHVRMKKRKRKENMKELLKTLKFGYGLIHSHTLLRNTS